MRTLLIIALSVMSLNSYAQKEFPKTFDQSWKNDFLEKADSFVVLNKKAFAISSILQDARIRIIRGNGNITGIQIKTDLNYRINYINETPIVYLSWILTKSLDFDIKNGEDTVTKTWTPTGNSPIEKLQRFIVFLSDNSLAAEIDIAPDLLYCIPKNAFINIKIDYEFKFSNLANISYEHKTNSARCLINDDGFIRLPFFFESAASNIDALQQNQSDTWIDALNNSYIMKLVSNQCLTYRQAEILLTQFYLTRLGNQSSVRNIIVTIQPDDFFASLTIICGDKTFNLPYEKKQFGQFFSDELVRRQIGFRKRKIKAIIFSKQTTIGTTRREVVYRFKRTSQSVQTVLNAGDIIYIK